MSNRSAGTRRRRARIALASVAVLLLAASFAFLIAQRQQPRSRARLTNGQGSAHESLGGLAALVQANIAAQREQTSERSTQVDRHQLRDPDDQPSASELPAIESARRVAKRWLGGYLPYEVGQLDSTVRNKITATSTRALSQALLADPPLIPPPQQRHRPPIGRVVGLITRITNKGNAQVYVAVTYGLEREGFRLTLTQLEHKWLVSAFHG